MWVGASLFLLCGLPFPQTDRKVLSVNLWIENDIIGKLMDVFVIEVILSFFLQPVPLAFLLSRPLTDLHLDSLFLLVLMGFPDFPSQALVTFILSRRDTPGTSSFILGTGFPWYWIFSHK
jgi:hypothetical protein